jgi:hypothetical protein
VDAFCVYITIPVPTVKFAALNPKTFQTVPFPVYDCSMLVTLVPAEAGKILSVPPKFVVGIARIVTGSGVTKVAWLVVFA